MSPARRPLIGACLAASCTWLAPAARPACAQALSQRGFVEVRGLTYAEKAPTGEARALASALVRYEASAAPAGWLNIAAAVDLRADSQGDVERCWRVDWDDRSLLRPAVSVRRLGITAARGGLSIEAGKQLVRWGKTDIVTPTDRFAPRDFLEVVVNDLVAVSAARVVYERAGRSIDLVWTPRMTPSRLPRPDRRWSGPGPEAGAVAPLDGGRELPAGGQAGVRWSQVAAGFEYSVSVFDGYNHLPSVERRLRTFPPALELVRVFPRLRMVGADLAWPLRWLTLKGEAAWFSSRDPRADEYVAYVVQAERQIGEWSLLGGYAGERVGRRGTSGVFAPDRGLAGSVLGRAALTIDAARSVAFEAAVRQDGHGALLKSEYSRVIADDWRATIAGVLIAGKRDDFLGQFRRNSHLSLAVRRSF